MPDNDIMEEVKKIVEITPKTSVEADTIRGDLKQTLEKIFPTIQINNQLLNVDDKYFFRTRKIIKEGNRFKFTKYDGKTSMPVYRDTEEEIKEEYQKYLETKQQRCDDWFTSIKSNLRAALEEHELGKSDVFDTLFVNKLPSNIQLNFRKYFTSELW
ncbi:MAG: hypothetical protein Nk1A_8250 [Endomicrobiia bacterium]|nr:MAG: hypothetical protein Nk1A_8250 [Endomicrobiia bacterium]